MPPIWSLDVCVDFGAKGDWLTDDSDAIQAASDAAALANAQTGEPGRCELHFPSGVYRITRTLNFAPFVNYKGVRATTANASGSTLSTSRGTILRTDPAFSGALVYVRTGDISIEGLTFVGNNQINDSPSIGIQWAKAVDSDPKNVAGVSISRCTFYCFTRAWAVYNLFDTYASECRFESNTIDVLWSGNPNLVANDVSFRDCVFFAHVVGFEFDLCPGMSHAIKVFGGEFIGTASVQTHIDCAVAAPTFALSLNGTDFSYPDGVENSAHFRFIASYDGVKNRLRCIGCNFTGGLINLQRVSGTALISGWEFAHCGFENTHLDLYAASEGQIIGGTFDNSYIAGLAFDLLIQGVIFKNNAMPALQPQPGSTNWMPLGCLGLP